MEGKGMVVNELYGAVAQYGLVETINKVFGKHAKMKLGFSQKACDISVEELALSVRGYNVLKRSGINTLGDLIDTINEQKIMSLRNLGEKTAKEIKRKVINLGYETLSETEKKEFLVEIMELNMK